MLIQLLENQQLIIGKQSQKKANFDYLHKKQTGGAGQYARVIGYV